MGIAGVFSEAADVRGLRPDGATLRAGIGGEEAVVLWLREGARGGGGHEEEEERQGHGASMIRELEGSSFSTHITNFCSARVCHYYGFVTWVVTARSKRLLENSWSD